MRIKLDTKLCSGHARCNAVAPEVFRLDETGYCAADGDIVRPGLEEAARRGARACPERAIELVKDDWSSMSTSTEEARKIAVDFFLDICAGRTEAAFARLASNVRYEIIAPPPVGGLFDRAGLARVLAELIAPALATQVALTIVGITAEGERVAMELCSEATDTRGRPYRNRYHMLAVVRGGQIVEMREYLDSAHLERMLTD